MVKLIGVVEQGSMATVGHYPQPGVGQGLIDGECVLGPNYIVVARNNERGGRQPPQTGGYYVRLKDTKHKYFPVVFAAWVSEDGILVFAVAALQLLPKCWFKGR